MGALHNRARLDADEIEWAADIGLPLSTAEDPAFSLPCPKLVDRKCSIFHSRPRVCPRYRCQLLRDTESGHVDLPTALGLVEQAHLLFRSAMASLTSESLAEARRRTRYTPLADLLSSSAAPKQALVEERLRVVALDVFLDRHFRNDKDQRMYRAAGGFGSGEMDVEKTGE